MKSEPVLIIGWEIFPEEFMINDEEEVYFRYNDIESDSAYDFCSCIANDLGLNAEMIGSFGDDARYFLTFNEYDKVDYNLEEMKSFIEQAVAMEKKLVIYGFVKPGSFFVGVGELFL